VIVLKLCQRNPAQTMELLNHHTEAPFADSLIIAYAYRNPGKLYDYAQLTDSLGNKIRSIDNPLVKSISQMASMKSGRFLFPFLDEIAHGGITIEEIDKVKDDPESYFKLLVKTEISYRERMQKGDTPFVMKVLTEKLQSQARDPFINQINALHDQTNDAIRFKIIEHLSPIELYYLSVVDEEEIYTSSYLGVYKRIFERMEIPRSDTLLRWVGYDFYKKFIKLSAAYNELDDFLRRMNPAEAEKLMQRFVSGLESTKTLEDAVDVANSFGSIDNAALRKLMQQQVQINLQQNIRSGNRRGQTIYRLLNTIFSSMDSTAGKIDVSASLGIRPIYQMPASLLRDSSGRIIVEQFFYGDKDGVNSFNSFLGTFNNPNWKITRKEEWVEVKSVKGAPITIYANKPLDNEKDLDAAAQRDLRDYMDSLDITPTIVIHRGHSYHVKSTIDQLPSSAQVVMLGSCGGYQSLNSVLTRCPEAQIIASKQVGADVINTALITRMMEVLRQSKDLNWPQMWRELESKVSGATHEKFDDYVPPYRNLGAIFIMAYNNEMAR